MGAVSATTCRCCGDPFDAAGPICICAGSLVEHIFPGVPRHCIVHCGLNPNNECPYRESRFRFISKGELSRMERSIT